MKTEPYWWFNGQSVSRLIEKLTEVESPRLEVHRHDDKLTFVVVDEATGKAIDPINDSHICPPQC